METLEDIKKEYVRSDNDKYRRHWNDTYSVRNAYLSKPQLIGNYISMTLSFMYKKGFRVNKYIVTIRFKLKAETRANELHIYLESTTLRNLVSTCESMGARVIVELYSYHSFDFRRLMNKRVEEYISIYDTLDDEIEQSISEIEKLKQEYEKMRNSQEFLQFIS